MKKALISGITGQDGSYLADFLLQKGYDVFGIIRRSSSFNTGRIEHLYLDKYIKDMSKPPQLKLMYGDLTDSSNLNRILEKVKPDEIYNLAAQSHVQVSFEVPEYTADVDALGVLRFLDAIKELGIKTKFYQASTSELYGKVKSTPQSEETPFNPVSPYAVAKMYAYWIVKSYRKAYNLFAVNGILFNHESPRRGETFVTRKITMGASRIKLGLQKKLYLGNLDAERDWGYAKEYVKGMWMMMQQEIPDDYVLATGKKYSVREFVELAFRFLNIELVWVGESVNEKGIDRKTKKVLVEIDPRYFRPVEVDLLIGDPSKAKKQLNWEPKTSLEELVEIMMESDYNHYKKQHNER